ncbi:MAG: restriction endonuclease subunit M [Dictyoglomus sp. NZ13-RE01]|nr:MAG: restriction endonuclease subunit M [Dictyoglomus sp. NZ13-RE01]
MKEIDLNFEDELWRAADKLRKKVEVHEYKYVVLGLIFLRYLSFAFEERRNELLNKERGYSEDIKLQLCEDRDFYLADKTLYIPEMARWDYIKKNANQPNIGEILDKAIEILENEYPDKLKDVIPKIYTRINLDHHDLSYLINLFSQIDFGTAHREKDIFGRIYEYFLGKFTEAEGKKGGEFYTPRCLTKLIVEILDIKGGRIFDPACGSGGFFVSAIEKLEREGIDPYNLSIYGQESKEFVWKMCKMNLVIRGAEGDIRIGDSYHDDKFFDLRADYIVSNPPFNDSGWGRDRVKPEDPRFKYGLPPENNGNFVWIQHYIYHLAPNGKAGFVMANGALSAGGIEGEIRKKIIEDDLVYGIIATPAKLFYTVSLPASLWFLRKSKPEHMRGKTLFIYAKNMYQPISRRQVTFTEEHIAKIVEKFRMFERGESEEKINEIGFAKVATLEEIAKNGYVLTPGRYVGIKLNNEEDETFEEKMQAYSSELSNLIREERELTEKIKEVYKSLGWEI